MNECAGADPDYRGVGTARYGWHLGPVPHEPTRRPQDRVPQGTVYRDKVYDHANYKIHVYKTGKPFCRSNKCRRSWYLKTNIVLALNTIVQYLPFFIHDRPVSPPLYARSSSISPSLYTIVQYLPWFSHAPGSFIHHLDINGPHSISYIGSVYRVIYQLIMVMRVHL